MLDIINTAGSLIRTAQVADEHVTVDRGEWDLFVQSWNQQIDYMDDMAMREDALRDDEHQRMAEARHVATMLR